MYSLSEECVVFLSIVTLPYIFVHWRPLIFISQQSNPCFDHQNLICLILTQLINWTPLVTRWFFCFHIHRSGWKQTHYKITEDRLGIGDLTSMVMVTKNHLHFQYNWGSVHKVFFFIKWFWNTNELQKSNQKFGIKILIKYNTINIRKKITNQTEW